MSEIVADLRWDREWLCGWRDVCRATDERTASPTFLPPAGFRLYAIDDRDDVDCILETFHTETSGLKTQRHRQLRDVSHKDMVLAAYDGMAAPEAASKEYVTPTTLPGHSPASAARNRSAMIRA